MFKFEMGLVPLARLELARDCSPRILSPLRLPFRHKGIICTLKYLINLVKHLKLKIFSEVNFFYLRVREQLFRRALCKNLTIIYYVTKINYG